MINVHDNYWIPSEGFEYITNGEVVTDSLYLGRGADIGAWWDTNESEILTDEDKAEAYDILLGGTE